MLWHVERLALPPAESSVVVRMEKWRPCVRVNVLVVQKQAPSDSQSGGAFFIPARNEGKNNAMKFYRKFFRVRLSMDGLEVTRTASKEVSHALAFFLRALGIGLGAWLLITAVRWW